MPRLRLITLVQYESTIYPGTGEIVRLPTYRLLVNLCWVVPSQRQKWRPSLVEDQDATFAAIVDTGAWLTNLPQAIWQPFRDHIRWIDVSTTPQRVSISSQTYEYRLGRVLLAALDLHGNWLAPAWTTVRLLHDSHQAAAPLLGLSSPFLMNRHILSHQEATAVGQQDSLPHWTLEPRTS